MIISAWKSQQVWISKIAIYYWALITKNVAMNNDCSTSDRIEDTQETGQVYFPVCGNYKKRISYYTI